jgi:hypothetical protein
MKNQNEKYCNECASVIRKNAYICPHCGVKQSGVNIDTEKLVQTAKVGSITTFVLIIVFIRWVARLVKIVGTLGGAVYSAYFYFNMGEHFSSEEELHASLAVTIISPIIGSIIDSKITKVLKKFNYDEK